MQESDIITVNQKDRAPDKYTLVNVDYAFACGGRCPDSLIRYAVTVTLVQLEFTASSRE